MFTDECEGRVKFSDEAHLEVRSAGFSVVGENRLNVRLGWIEQSYPAAHLLDAITRSCIR